MVRKSNLGGRLIADIRNSFTKTFWIIGTGWAVPKGIRLNNDPIFGPLKAKFPNNTFFEGYKVRHVLGAGEDLMTIMVPAAKMAMQRAKKKPKDIDLLIGLGSISDYIQPNTLSQLHNELKLPVS